MESKLFGQAEIEPLEVNRITLGKHEQENHEREEHKGSEENPIDRLLLMIQVHENVSHQR